MEIQLIEQGSKGISQAKEGSVIAGEMTYSIPGTDFIIIDHTEVNESYKGRGVGKQILMEVVEMARDKNLKILPLCPFAHAMFKKISEIRDVLK